TTDTIADVRVWAYIPFDLNGALTLGLPIIDIDNFKLNLGANLRLNVFVNSHEYVNALVNVAGLEYSSVENKPIKDNTNNIYDYIEHGSNIWNIRNWAIDLGAYLRLSENFALGISAQNVYAQWLGGEYNWQYEIGYFVYDNSGNLVKNDYPEGSYTETGSIPPEDIEVEFGIPPLSLKAGAMLKVPTLNTKVAFDIDLDKNFQPTLYRLGVEQPLFFLVVRSGAIFDTNFQPIYYTFGAGINLLILRVDAGLGYQARGSIIETIQNTPPLVASLSGSIQF
ncbi:MAG: hypothetical protein ACPLKX_01165, partial [Dictyoglomaceae bacterium]